MKNLLDKIKSLFEKVKSLDKKILIGAGAGLVLVIVLVVALIIGLGSKETNKEDDKTKVEQNDDKDKDKDEDKDKEEESDDKEEATFTVKVVDADGAAVAGVTVQVCKDECVPATTDETGVATFNLEITEGYKLSVVTCPEGYEYTGEAEIALTAGITEYELKIQKKAESTDGGNANNSNGGGTTATQQPTITKPDGTEIIGAGSKDQPYLEIPTNMTVTTVSIPAGKTLYYGIRGAGNRILTINSSNAYVIEADGTRHNASGGKVSFMTENANDSEYVTFQIGNSGSSAATFTIKLSNPTGSRENPTIIKTISSVSNGCSLSLANGSETGHFYKYVAERKGTIRFYISSYKSSTNGAQGSIKVDKILPGDVVEQTTFDDENAVKTEIDDKGNVLYTYIEVSVEANDVLYINVASISTSKRTPFPAADITWVAKY